MARVVGPNPPFHTSVFVLTEDAEDALRMLPVEADEENGCVD